MFISRVGGELLKTRLDCQYYSPVALDLDKKLNALGMVEHIDSHIDAGRSITNGVRGPELEQTEYKLVRLQDCCEWEVNFTRCLTISKSQFDANARCELRVDDIVVAIGGYVGNAAIVVRFDRAVIGQHSALVPLLSNGKLVPRFLLAYLNSRHGETQFTRLLRGTVQQGLNLEDIGGIEVPVPMTHSQRYVAEKVHQAERLRERARELERESKQFFALPEWTAPRAGARRAFRSPARSLREARLDAPFYDPGHEALDELLTSKGGRPIGEHAQLVRSGWRRDVPEFLYFEIGELDLTSGVVTPSRLPTSQAPSRAQIGVQAWDVLVSTVRPNRKNVGLVLPAEDALPLVASTGFSVLRFSSPESAVFFQAWLRSDAATQQLMRWNSGATYPAIESEVPLQVLAPSYPEETIEEKGRRWRSKFEVQSLSSRLTTAAKLLVEALIEGKVSESDLIEAQQALERGDRAADRALLQRLTRTSIDNAGEPPLFPDLDALYAALDEPASGEAPA